jgi:hypothetical protein
MPKYGKDHPDLGRRVKVADMLAVHPGDANRCLCRGTAEVNLLVKGEKVLKICDRALTAFRKRCAFRVLDTPSGPHWLPGCSPEEWDLARIFYGSVREYQWQERLRRQFAARA